MSREGLTFNGLAYAWAISLTSLSMYITFKSRRSWFSREIAQQNSEFRSLQRTFLFPSLLIYLADSIQAPYLYLLYYSYGFQPAQIAVLYVVGLTMNLVSTIITIHILSRFGRKLTCLCCIASGSLACLMKFSDNYLVLLIGRLLDGFSAALLVTPFHQWYGHEHVLSYDFPKEWLASTFSTLSTAAAFLSVGAGFIAEFSELGSSVTAFPFFIAILFQIAGGSYIIKYWPENRLASEYRVRLLKQFSSALSIFKKEPIVLVVCIIHTFFESTIQLFIFVWTPVLLHSKRVFSHRISYGGVYAAFMSSTLLGNLIHRLTQKRCSVTNILCLSTAVALIAFIFSYAIVPYDLHLWTARKFFFMFILFCIFEFACGLYLPAMSKLQQELAPPEHRTSLLAILRIPLTLLASLGILGFSLPVVDSKGEIQQITEWRILLMGCVLISLCTVSALLLSVAMGRRIADDYGDHFFISFQRSNTLPVNAEDAERLRTISLS
ncbi:hypothetical protein AB6A40_007779 [Gnathostoma spinigerum]|uniref:Molybdate-anion transporter n=1 Tax=Gnathostoma spinigerum TaxID=75299 RepID=A0ABD6ENH0_9BILA